MRSQEFITEEQVEENWKRAAGTAALATGMGLGALGYNYLGQKPTPAQTPIIKSQVATKVTANNMETMGSQQLQDFIRKNTQHITWAPHEFEQFMGQIMHETKNLRRMSENLFYTTPQRIYNHFTSSFKKNPREAEKYINNPEALANKVYANRLGNGNEASGDGWRYRGRGFLHITGRELYDKVGRAIGVDLVNNPDLLAIDADVSLKAALWYWANMVKPKVGQKFNDTKRVTQAINPALAGIENRKEQFRQQQKQQSPQPAPSKPPAKPQTPQQNKKP